MSQDDLCARATSKQRLNQEHDCKPASSLASSVPSPGPSPLEFAHNAPSQTNASSRDVELVSQFYRHVTSVHTILRSQGMSANEAAALALRVAAGMAKMPTLVSDVRARLTEARAQLRHVKDMHVQRLLHPEPSPPSSPSLSSLSSPSAPASPSSPWPPGPAPPEPGACAAPSHEAVVEADQAAQCALGQAAHLVFLLFSSLDSMHAAFWKPPSDLDPTQDQGPGPTSSAAAAVPALALGKQSRGGEEAKEPDPEMSSSWPSLVQPQPQQQQQQERPEQGQAATADGQSLVPSLAPEPLVLSPSAPSAPRKTSSSSSPRATSIAAASQLPTPSGTAASPQLPAPQASASSLLPSTPAAFTPQLPPASPRPVSSALGSSQGGASSRAMDEEQRQLDLLDLPAARALYTELLSGGEQLLLVALKRGLEQLLETIGMTSITSNPGLIRQLAIILACPLLEDMDHANLLESLCSFLVGMSGWMQQKLVSFLSGFDKVQLQRLVVMLQQYITLTLYQQQAITRGVEDATQALGLVHRANELHRRLPLAEFYNDAVNNEDFNIKEDFRRWKAPFQRDFSFCTCPYVYDPSSKARLLQLENQMAQFNELQGALFRGLMSGSDPLDMCPFLVLKVRRGAHLVQDTLVQINRAKDLDCLRKPLKVKFVGEEGVDEGGVQKEFFQLLVRELFNPDYGMFTYDETTRLNWFRPSDLDMDLEYELVGILIGLAIYNSHILEFQFPQVLYKRLMGLSVGLDDIKELHPEVHASLSKLRTYEGDLSELGLCFQVNMEVGFGEIATVDLVPGGSSLSVSSDNLEQYIAAYTRHLLESSIDRQFTHFRAGFLRLCSGAALSWFRPEELELLICGGQELNLEALEATTLYDDGYTPTSQVVRWFWEVTHALSESRKKQLLFFVTGSDRVPIKGLGHLNPPFVISRMGGDSDRLPTAHTCFNHLLLPQYSGKDVLSQRLECALDNSEGFGLM